jgi:hypothetical protein
VEQSELERLVVYLARRMGAPVYWQDPAGGWYAYQGRGVFERGRWERAQWVPMSRVNPQGAS